jgi:hypothetical protein
LRATPVLLPARANLAVQPLVKERLCGFEQMSDPSRFTISSVSAEHSAPGWLPVSLRAARELRQISRVTRNVVN